MGGRAGRVLTGWLLLVAAGQVMAFVWVWTFFVRTERGQRLDFISLTGNRIGQERVDGLVNSVLQAMSVVSLVIATAVIGFIALIRGRIAVAVVATTLVAGANITTQLLKHGIDRPDLGVDAVRAAAGNSLPSGHTALAASVAVGLVFVLPPRVRGLGGLLGAGYAALAGVATLSAGWHRPSDAVAALLVVGAWAAVAGVPLVVLRRRAGAVQREDPHRFAVSGLAIGGLLLLAVAVVALRLTDQLLLIPPRELGRRRLLVAYAGGAAGVAGTASLVMTVVLATVHRVVPGAGGRA